MDGKRWHTREDSGLRLDRQFRWWHDDELIEHPNIIEAFNRGLRVEEGRITLHFGNDWCVVQVEDAPFRVNAIDVSEGRVSVRLSDRTAEWLDPSTLSLDDDGVLSIRVKAGAAKARFGREAQFQLASSFIVDGDSVVLELDGAKVMTSLPATALSA